MNEQTLKDIFYCVEADRFAQSALYDKYFLSNKWISSWENDADGYLKEIGTFNGYPITISFSFATIEGRRVLFYSSPSVVTNWNKVYEWLEEHVPSMVSNHSDATNFGNCIAAIRQSFRGESN
jgi:hypothetical protein